MVLRPAAPKSRRITPMIKTVAASRGRPSQPTVTGVTAFWINSRAPVSWRTLMISAPRANRGVASRIKWCDFVTVFLRTFPNRGQRSAGRSMSRAVDFPGIKVLSRVPAIIRTETITRI